jgi:hypothetical protein
MTKFQFFYIHFNSSKIINFLIIYILYININLILGAYQFSLCKFLTKAYLSRIYYYLVDFKWSDLNCEFM